MGEIIFSQKYKNGEVIDLVWDSPGPKFLYVKGHHTPCETKKIIDQYYAEEWEFKYKFETPHRMYGIWSIEWFDGERSHVLRDYKEPGRGRFPVMRAKVISGNWYVRRD